MRTTFYALTLTAALTLGGARAAAAGGSVDKATGDIRVDLGVTGEAAATAHIVFDAHDADAAKAKPAKGAVTLTRYSDTGAYYDTWTLEVKCVNIIDATVGYLAAQVTYTDYAGGHQPAKPGGVQIFEVADNGSDDTAVDTVSWDWDANKSVTDACSTVAAATPETWGSGATGPRRDRTEIDGNLVIHTGQGHVS